MKMDISWWWESHNRPKHSKWLLENLGDVEANVQQMLSLIEGDADSFAQRAEMYYKKRPDLLKVVEQFYRGYRALAERYDQLTGGVRQIPSSLQTQYGLVTESPRSSPFSKQITFKKQQESGLKENSEFSSYSDSNQVSPCEGEADSEVSMDGKSTTFDGEDSSSVSSSDGESDQTRQEIRKLQMTLESLQAENKMLNEKARDKQQQYRETERRLHGFREDFLRVQKENNTLKATLAANEKHTKSLEDEKSSLSGDIQMLETRVSSLQEENEKLNSAIKDMQERNEKLLDQIEESGERRKELEDEVSKLKDELHGLKLAMEEIHGKVSEANEQLCILREENDKQRLDILEYGEEKREAIRQLCFSMEMLKERNHWLEELLLSAKTRLINYQKMVLSQGSSSKWKGIFAT